MQFWVSNINLSLADTNSLLSCRENSVSLLKHIENIREKLKKGSYTSEAAVSQGVLLPTLYELGWQIFDTNLVIPEYSLGGRRVDFALCYPALKPAIFIEVKKVGYADGADRQLFEYAFHEGIPMAILTDGLEWSFYLPGEQGKYDDRRVYKLDFLEREPEEILYRLERYLRCEKVVNGRALTDARKDYLDISRTREISAVLPKAWDDLLNEPDSLLLDLLAEKVEDLCGYKPSLDACSKFLSGFNESPKKDDLTNLGKAEQRKPDTVDLTDLINTQPALRQLNYFLEYDKRKQSFKSAREVMVRLFQLLSEKDSSFLERFASRKHGKKRRYIAKNKDELYPGRPDLASDHSVLIEPGWWIGVNYSRHNISQIIELALEVSANDIRSKIQWSVG